MQTLNSYSAESKIQSEIIRKLTQRNWYVIKLIKTNKNGIPDLLCLKRGMAVFIETKSTKGKLTKLQEHRLNELKRLGFAGIIVRDVRSAIEFCEDCEGI